MGDGMNIFGQEVSERDLRRRTGDIAAVGGLRRMRLQDDVGAGIELVEVRTAAGLSFDVLLSRAFDIGRFEYRGVPIGWRSGTGFRHPGLHDFADEGGLSWLRSFDGLLVTAGLDHTLFTTEADASHFHYPHRKTTWNGLHGRIGNIPGRLTRASEEWTEQGCTIVVEGEIRQAAVFGENLVLHRRIEADLDDSELRLTDRVVNRGFSRTPHMYLYHLNFGWPLVDAGTRLVAPIRSTRWQSESASIQGVPYDVLPEPRPDFVEQVYEHELVASEDGTLRVALLNEQRGLGLEVRWDATAFPHFFEWLHLRDGAYAVGLEPSSNHVEGSLPAREAGEVRWLEHGESAEYRTSIRVLEGADALHSAEERIRAVHGQPEAG